MNLGNFKTKALDIFESMPWFFIIIGLIIGYNAFFKEESHINKNSDSVTGNNYWIDIASACIDEYKYLSSTCDSSKVFDNEGLSKINKCYEFNSLYTSFNWCSEGKKKGYTFDSIFNPYPFDEIDQNILSERLKPITNKPKEDKSFKNWLDKKCLINTYDKMKDESGDSICDTVNCCSIMNCSKTKKELCLEYGCDLNISEELICEKHIKSMLSEIAIEEFFNKTITK